MTLNTTDKIYKIFDNIKDIRDILNEITFCFIFLIYIYIYIYIFIKKYIIYIYDISNIFIRKIFLKIKISHQ